MRWKTDDQSRRARRKGMRVQKEIWRNMAVAA
jgi:hypothetical protein